MAVCTAVQRLAQSSLDRPSTSPRWDLAPHAARLLRFQHLGMPTRAMLQDALTRLKRQVQPVVSRIALFQLIHHPQRLQVVLEPAMGLHAPVQRILPGVPERGVAEVMGQ